MLTGVVGITILKLLRQLKLLLSQLLLQLSNRRLLDIVNLLSESQLFRLRCCRRELHKVSIGVGTELDICTFVATDFVVV